MWIDTDSVYVGARGVVPAPRGTVVALLLGRCSTFVLQLPLPNERIHESRGIVVARAVLIAVHASLKEPRPPLDPVLVFPDDAPLGRRAAEAWLANLRKPVLCVAFDAAGQLALGAWPADPLNASDDPSFFSLVGRFTKERAAGVRVVFEGEESITISLDDYESWLREYRLPLVCFYLDAEPAEDRDTVMVRFGPPNTGYFRQVL